VIAVNPVIECLRWDLVPEYCQGLESSAVYTAPPFFVESVNGRSNRSLPCPSLHMHAEPIIPTFLTSNIYIRICLPEAFTLTQLRSYEMFEVLLIAKINQSVGLQGILNFRLPRDAVQYWLARGIPLNEGVLHPLQSKVRTPPPHLR
jgi:hypothetical protein